MGKLDGLDAAFQDLVKGAKRKTLVFGDRFPFRYFADAYGLRYFAAFPGCSTETECSAATVAFLINKVRAENIPTVFHIELSNEKIADAICEETGAKKLLLHAAHNITKKDFDGGISYHDLMSQNLKTLREALY
jgi:zinc transport system substrate-binding protein